MKVNWHCVLLSTLLALLVLMVTGPSASAQDNVRGRNVLVQRPVSYLQSLCHFLDETLIIVFEKTRRKVVYKNRFKFSLLIS